MIQDLKLALRALSRQRVFALSAVLTLAIGIGGNAAVFTIVESVLLRPLPYPRSDRLVAITSVAPGMPFANSAFSRARATEWQASARTFSVLSASSGGSKTLTGTGDPVRLFVARVDERFFEVFGVGAQVGRSLGANPGRDVVLAWTVWSSRFGGDPRLVGRSITLDGEAYTVIGIMPATFRYPVPAEAWIPLVLTTEERLPNRAFLGVIGRLADGVRPADADRELQSIAAPGASAWSAAGRQGSGKARPPQQIRTETLLERQVGGSRPTLLMLWAAVALVLVIACVNVANLLLSRTIQRREEVAVRVALGAGRRRLLRQLLTESFVIAIAGGWLGLLMAVWLVRGIVHLAPPDVQRLDSVHLDPWAAAFAALVSIAAGLAAGAVPALHALGSDVADLLRGARRGAAVAGSHRTQSVLIGVEMAVTVVLLAGGLLLVSSLIRLVRVETGFSPERTLAFEVALPPARYPTDAERRDYAARALDELAAANGVEAVGASMGAPFSNWMFAQTIKSPEAPAAVSPLFQPVGGRYFDALRIPLVKGRLFNAADRSGTAPVAIVSETLARTMWPGRDAVGARFTMESPDAAEAAVEWQVVGVVKDVRHTSLREALAETLYVPIAQHPTSQFTLLVRTSGDPLAAVPGVRSALTRVDRDIPLTGLSTMEARLARTLEQPTFYALVLSVFAGIAIVLALVGVYGLVAYFIAQRKQDLGIHVALGAEARHIIALVLRIGVLPVSLGLAAGTAVAIVATRLLTRLLFGVAPGDPITMALAAGLLLAAAVAACYVPARRAARIDPAAALRIS